MAWRLYGIDGGCMIVGSPEGVPSARFSLLDSRLLACGEKEKRLVSPSGKGDAKNVTQY